MRLLYAGAPAILPAVGQRRTHAARLKRTPWLIAVGRRFRALREANHVGQDALPSPRPTVSKFENGGGVNLALFETWCRAAGIDPAAPFTESARQPAESVQNDTEKSVRRLPPAPVERMTYPVMAEVLNQLGIPQEALRMDPITEDELLEILQRRKADRARRTSDPPEKKGEPRARGRLQHSRKR
jgi:transcriptional regulator with XRE-family HTH domain